MVVDDNIHMIQIIRAILKGFGAVKIFEARDAVDAFDRLKTHSVDIVIVDYNMPVLDGIDFTKLIRTSSDSPNRFLPVIMVSAHSEKTRVQAARDAGVDEFCVKPVTANELYRKISSIVNNQRAHIKLASFTGPDRRRHPTKNYSGVERRGSMMGVGQAPFSGAADE
jgi:two-component system chemotaxis response regulator CheY